MDADLKNLLVRRNWLANQRRLAAEPVALTGFGEFKEPVILTAEQMDAVDETAGLSHQGSQS
jgi:hypothetical protein